MSRIKDARLQAQSEPAPDLRPLNTLIDSTVAARLRENGVVTIDDWLALGRKRFLIFGVTRVMASRIDEAIAEATR